MGGLRSATQRGTGDTGGMIAGWLIRLAVAMTVAGVLLFDGIALGLAHLNVPDDADEAAVAAADDFAQRHDMQSAYDTAVTAATTANATNVVEDKTFRVLPDGSVHLVIDRAVPTLVVKRISRIAGWAHVHEAGTGRHAA